MTEAMEVMKPFLDEGREIICFSISDSMSTSGNVMTGLQGRVSGLWVRKLSGDAGANPEFVIRGHQSSNLSVQPLIAVSYTHLQNQGSE